MPHSAKCNNGEIDQARALSAPVCDLEGAHLPRSVLTSRPRELSHLTYIYAGIHISLIAGASTITELFTDRPAGTTWAFAPKLRVVCLSAPARPRRRSK